MFALVLILLLHHAMADVCRDLDVFLSLNGGSYAKGLVCHGLFWTSSDKTSICFYSTATKGVCPTSWAVSVIDAGIFLSDQSTTTVAAVTTSTISQSGSMTTTTVTADTTVSISAISTTTTTTAVVSSSAAPFNLTASFLAFGDWGLMSESLTATIGKINAKFFSTTYPLNGVFLLGDNFYPRGISHDLSIRDPQFNLFSDFVGASAPEYVQFYPVLGNHDWMGNVRAQIAFSSLDRKWVFPDFFHFKRFQIDDVSLCVWFIDTERFASDAGQQTWFRESLRSEKSTCSWTIVNGHYPVFTGGEYTRCTTLARFRESILPIMRDNRIDLYLSGHEHQSQILKEDEYNTVYVVAGAVSDMRGVRVNGNENMKWINSRIVGFSEIQVSGNELRVLFHRSYGGIDAEPFCESRLSKMASSQYIVLTLSGCEI